MTPIQKIREWCDDKNSPWFTMRDLIERAGLDPDYAQAYMKHLLVEEEVRHEPGSRWYKLVSTDKRLQFYAYEKIGVAAMNTEAAHKAVFTV